MGGVGGGKLDAAEPCLPEGEGLTKRRADGLIFVEIVPRITPVGIGAKRQGAEPVLDAFVEVIVALAWQRRRPEVLTERCRGRIAGIAQMRREALGEGPHEAG